jgi:hypothetical protein
LREVQNVSHLCRLNRCDRVDAYSPLQSVRTAVAQTEAADKTHARTGRDSVLACVGRLLVVAIDDQPLPSPGWHAATDASSRLRDVLTYLPITTLPD